MGESDKPSETEIISKSIKSGSEFEGTGRRIAQAINKITRAEITRAEKQVATNKEETRVFTDSIDSETNLEAHGKSQDTEGKRQNVAK